MRRPQHLLLPFLIYSQYKMLAKLAALTRVAGRDKWTQTDRFGETELK